MTCFVQFPGMALALSSIINVFYSTDHAHIRHVVRPCKDRNVPYLPLNMNNYLAMPHVSLLRNVLVFALSVIDARALYDHTLECNRTSPQVQVWSLVFVAIGAVSIIATIIQLVRREEHCRWRVLRMNDHMRPVWTTAYPVQGCFGIVAQRLTRRIRVRTLHAILHQARTSLSRRSPSVFLTISCAILISRSMLVRTLSGSTLSSAGNGMV